MQINCSIIIVYHSDLKLLINCLKSISQHAPKTCETIVINNSCKKIPFDFTGQPRLRLINNDQNVGFAQACNQGASDAIGEYLLFLNPDTELTDNFIAIGIEILKGNDKVGIVAPSLKSSMDEMQISAYHFPTIKNLLAESLFIDKIIGQRIDFGNAPIIGNNDHNYLTVDWLCGAALLMRKADYFSVGGFDQIYFMYFEDVDLCKNISAFGKIVLYLPQKTIIHRDKKQSDLYNAKFDSKAKIGFINTSIIHYWRKHCSTRPRIEGLLVLRSLIRFLIWGFIYCIGGSNGPKERMIGYLSVLRLLVWK